MIGEWTAIYFGPDEFKCKCGRPDCDSADVHPQFVGMLDIARHQAGIPFAVNSGTRCEQHNALVGGSDTSSHLTGLAADIRCSNGQERLAIVRGLLAAGIYRIGIARGFVHADIDPDKMHSMWVY